MEVANNPKRICHSCRTKKPRHELIRLTVDFKTNRVWINQADKRIFGRSTYLCKSEKCLSQLLKGNRLKNALEGRKKKGVEVKRSIKWPIESQLIKAIADLCTESDKTCQNTKTQK